MKRTGLVGGVRKTAAYMDRIEHRAKELARADRPKKKRELLPNEENQMLLPFLEGESND